MRTTITPGQWQPWTAVFFVRFSAGFLGVFWEISFVFREFALRLSTIKKSKKKAEFSDCFQVCFPHHSCFTKANFFKATFTSAQFSFKFRKTIGKVLRNASLRVFHQMNNYI